MIKTVWNMIVASLALSMAVSVKHQCQCPCACSPNGLKLKDLINCFATWQENVATDAWNSHLDGCSEKNIVHCRLANPNEEHFCLFDGTNHLVETQDHPTCYYNCGMQSCDAFLIAYSPHEIDCIANVFNDTDD